jgi:hypothetical protein
MGRLFGGSFIAVLLCALHLGVDVASAAPSAAPTGEVAELQQDLIAAIQSHDATSFAEVMSHSFPLDYHFHDYTPLTAVLAARSAATERFDNSTEPPLAEQHTLLANMLVALLDAGADAGFACPGIDAIMLRDLHALELLLGRMSAEALSACLRGISEGGSSRFVGRSGGMLHVAGFSPSVGFARLFFRMRRLAQRGEWADAPSADAAAAARPGRRGRKHAPADALAALQEHLGLHDTAAVWDEEHEEAGRQGIDDALGAAEADALIVHGVLLGVDVADPVYLEGLNGDGLTPLLMACLYGRAPVVAVLLELGANPWAAAAPRFNFTCGHLAASRGYSGVLAVLRGHSPEAAATLQHATDAFGRTAADVADAMRAVGQAEGASASAGEVGPPVVDPRFVAAGAAGNRQAAEAQPAGRPCSCPSGDARVGVASDTLRGFNPAAHVAAGWRLAHPSDLPALLLPEDFWWRQAVRAAEAQLQHLELQRDDENAADGSGVRDAAVLADAPCTCAPGGMAGTNPALAQRSEQERLQLRQAVPRLGRQPDVIAADTAFPVPLLSEATVLAQHPPPAFIRDVVSLERPYVVQLARLPADIVPRLPRCSRDRLDAAARANSSDAAAAAAAAAALLAECTPHSSAARFGAAPSVAATSPAAPDSPGAGFAASYISRLHLLEIMGLLRVAEGLTPYSTSYGFGGSNVPLHSFVRAAMGTHAAAVARDGQRGSAPKASSPLSAGPPDEPPAEGWLQRVQESLLRSWEVIGADASAHVGPDGRARPAALGQLLPEGRFNLSTLLAGARAAHDNSSRRNGGRGSGQQSTSTHGRPSNADAHSALRPDFGFSGPGAGSSAEAEGRDGAVSASPVFPHYIFDGILLNTERYTPLFDALTAAIPSALLAPRNHHRQLIVGPPLSGAMPHFHNPALNLLLVGVKLWVLLPPGNATFGQSHARHWFEDSYRRKYAGLPAEGLAVDAVEAAAAALLAEEGETQTEGRLGRKGHRGVNWIDTRDGQAPDAPAAGGGGEHSSNQSNDLPGISGARWSFCPQPVPHYRFLQEAGDLVFVPEHWGHAVINLSDTVAVAIE